MYQKLIIKLSQIKIRVLHIVLFCLVIDAALVSTITYLLFW